MIYGLVFTIGLLFDLFTINLLGRTSLFLVLLIFVVETVFKNWRVYFTEQRLSRRQ